jgi:hypothetical protein
MLAGLAGLVPAAALDPYAPPPNLGALSQAGQLEYFNLVVNRVRAEKPGFRQRELLQIANTRTSLMGGLLDVMLNSIIGKLMPTEWVERNVEAGQSNEGLFLSENANASDLRPEDISSIKSTKEGDSWVIDVFVKDALNPQSGLGSTVSRIAPMQTREEIVGEIVGVGSITADPANASVRYRYVFASVTVSEEGKVIAAANGFQARVQVNDVAVSIITTDITATQSAEWQCAYFDWAPQENFPPAHVFPPDQWWESLPIWFQWLLRYVFFGWLWME